MLKDLQQAATQDSQIGAALAEATRTMAEPVAEQHPEIRFIRLLQEWGLSRTP